MSKLIDKLLAQLPIIGPHAGIEAELLAAGRKPLGWIPVNDALTDQTYMSEAAIAKEEADVIMLDDLVAKGQLISKDAEIYIETDGAPKRYRHYAQIDNEKYLNFCQAINEKALNQEDVSSLSEQADISAGTMLGYRKRDQALFQVILPSLYVPTFIKKALCTASPVIREAYQRDLLRQIAEDKNSKPVDEGGIDAAGVDPLSQFTMAVSVEELKGVDNQETQSSPHAKSHRDTNSFTPPK
jgi:hypothetical protein